MFICFEKILSHAAEENRNSVLQLEVQKAFNMHEQQFHNSVK